MMSSPNPIPSTPLDIKHSKHCPKLNKRVEISKHNAKRHELPILMLPHQMWQRLNDLTQKQEREERAEVR